MKFQFYIVCITLFDWHGDAYLELYKINLQEERAELHVSTSNSLDADIQFPQNVIVLVSRACDLIWRKAEKIQTKIKLP